MNSNGSRRESMQKGFTPNERIVVVCPEERGYKPMVDNRQSPPRNNPPTGGSNVFIVKPGGSQREK